MAAADVLASEVVRYLKHAGSSALPRTLVGRWLRAAMLDQPEERDRLVRTLNGWSATGWNDDEPAVVQVAFELMLPRYYASSDQESGELEGLIGVVKRALAADNRAGDGPPEG
jgi:hypothetical protein